MDIVKESNALDSIRAEKKKVLILYTGGTMGMIPEADGSLAPKEGYLTEVIINMPELKRDEMPQCTVKEYVPLLDSSAMGPAHWSKIATDIEENYLHYDGFVVIMGTDTMAYASSALSFMLENLGKSVIFTGSQIPFHDVYNDARRNLIVAIIFAVNSDIPEVCICFNDKILRANRTIKVNSLSFNAFESPNFPPLANLGATVVENRDIVLPPPRGTLKVHKQLDAHVLVIKLVPGFDDESIQTLVDHTKTLKGIVLELYGTGNGPSKKQGLLDAIRRARDKGIVVAAVSQCLQGGVSLDTYTMGRDFQQVGVVSGEDMTTEACTTKLAYLFGRIQDPDLVAKMLNENIRGELTPASNRKRKYLQVSSLDKTYKL